MSHAKQVGRKKVKEAYPIQTAQEADALMRAASDGKHGEHWHDVEQVAACVFEVPGLSHSIRLQLTSDEQSAGLTLDALNELREMQDSDSAFALLYVSRLMTEKQPSAQSPTTNIKVALDDIITAIGFDPRTTAQRAEMRRRVWAFIKFGARAEIVGQRSARYQDKLTGKEIETRIESSPWTIASRAMAEQRSLFPDGDIPLIVELAPSEEWMRLLLNPSTAQFLPCAEILGTIPPARAAGAWARVIGLSLANLWRRKPREALAGTLRPSRKDLLLQYLPAVSNPRDVLNSSDPRHALRYWANALNILCECRFVERKGEAALSYEQMSDAMPRQDWQQDWFYGTAELWPGPLLSDPLLQIKNMLPEPKPRDLTKKTKKRV